MTKFVRLVAIAVFTFAAASGAGAADFTKGTVKKIDAKAKKVTLIHEELKELGMPAMTMVFRVQEDGLLGKLKEGAEVEFVAERVDGKLTVTQVK